MAVSRLIQPSDLKRSDVVVFHPETHVFEIWRIRAGTRERLVARPCSGIRDKQYLLDLVRLMGGEANPPLTNTVEDNLFSQQGAWAYKYI